VDRETPTGAAGVGAAQTPADGQLSLVRAQARERLRRASPRPPDPVAAELPVAQVAVDVQLTHLDRTFDYLVPEPLSAAAVPGARVRVRFAGQDLAGFVLDRCDASDHAGRLDRIRRVVSPEPVLTPDVARLARLVADRYAGTLADVLRLAVPPRHARVEREPSAVPAGGELTAPEPGEWASYPAGQAFLDALGRAGAAPRAVWAALPGADWPDLLARAAAATAAGSRGALIVVPDQRDVDRVDAALAALLGSGRHVALTAELGPAERYRRWLRVLRGSVPIVVGTRAAMFAPVQRLGLVAVWDDGDDLHAEPRAPYPHVREVLCLRAHITGAAALVAGFGRTVEGAALVARGWARELLPERRAVRAAQPRVIGLGDDAQLARDGAAAAARLPTVAWQAARDGLQHGPVLVQVPRRGYVPSLACRSCRQPARCTVCQGPLAVRSGGEAPRCTWCAALAARWECAHCGDTALRAQVVGARRTAEELGRAFPGIAVRTSGRDGVLASVGAEPALVVATPGAEPVADGRYAAALLLDGWALLSRPDLRAAEEALRRWLTAAALVRPASSGGTVVVLADTSLPPVQALVRWDPVTHARRELDDRAQAGLPPASRVATVTGPPAAVADLLATVSLPSSAAVLGPVAWGDGERLVVRVPAADGPALAAALHAGQAVRSARKAPDAVRVAIDPLDLG
jgi:primosomal protein N' (replication factor Y)